MNEINLLPRHRMLALRSRKRLRFWAAALAANAAMLVIACVAARVAWGGAGGADERQLRSAELGLRQTETLIGVVKNELASLHTRQRLVTMLTDQPDWADFLRLMGDRLGSDLVLREVKLQRTMGAGAAGVRPPASLLQGSQYKLEMRGLARAQRSISQYVTALEKTNLFDEVRLLRTGREPFLTGAATTFELECRLHDSGGN